MPTWASSPNDDGFSGPIPLGFVLNLFGTDYTEFWANNNGNVSFTDGLDSWLPGALSVGTFRSSRRFLRMSTPRGAGSGLMHLRNDIPNEIIVTWDQVGYYNQNTDKLNSFQLVIRGPGLRHPRRGGASGLLLQDHGLGNG